MQYMLILLTLTVIYFTPGSLEVLDNDKKFDFHECSKFFYKQKEPLGLSGQKSARICQSYKHNGVVSQYFATLYDRERRIPLYSAYIFKGKNKEKRPKNITWMIEPQLAYVNLTKCMADEKAVTDQEQLIKSQAVNNDYKMLYKRNPRYNHGHLNPSMHQNTNESKNATFTLTNIVPQTVESNLNWSAYEQSILNVSGYYKCFEIFLITGVIPTKIDPSERVNIPSHVWSAYCCVDQNGMPIKNGAAWILNTVTSLPQSLRLQELENILQEVPFFENNIQIFYEGCAKSFI
ncbi:endonuclease domain-containing 1 protein-like [Protopterus annectens]|uniref:endonuclease domain-containing 1 protein-like n=1 Tax=Protopterus annectens TaxID=7888 RepID=UPI001CF9B4EC|nr:endonuclease domain-containing 1 protein-like [Protopterus annectens]